MTIDAGLLSPVTAGEDALVSDVAIADALVTAEVALTRAWGAVGVVDGTVGAAPAAAVEAVSAEFGWAGPGAPCTAARVDPAALAIAAVEHGNPVIALVAGMRQRVPADAGAWIHRGATSQDVVDSALMLVAARASASIDGSVRGIVASLAAFADEHRATVAAARTLTQHAVPTTWGARAAAWARGIERARQRLADSAAALPAQLGGAAGTLSAVVELADADVARALPGALASELGLARPDAPWHTTRWPVTELGDALVQLVDALGVLGADVANAARTEVGELRTGATGGSSAMPQKQNPVGAVLLRSAALRAPQLGATLHLAAASAVDERPDGAWHAEWPTLRELLRLALGAAAHAEALVRGMQVDRDAVARTLGASGGLIVAERLRIVLVPRIGAERFAQLIAAASAGGDLAALVAALTGVDGLGVDAIDVPALLDPARATGLAVELATLVPEDGSA